MGSRVFLTNLASDVSGYKLALVDMRNPNLPSSVASATTNATSSGSNIQMTATAGGSAIKWITRKLGVAVSLGAVTGEAVQFNFSGKESAASVNAGFQVRLAKYTGGSEGSSILTDNDATELAATTGPNMWTSSASYTSTAFAVGDRLVISPYINNVGTMAAGSVIMDYDGAAGADGDTYLEVYPVLQVSQAQIGSASAPGVTSKSVTYFKSIANSLQIADPGGTSGGWLSDDTTVLAAINEANNQANLE